MKAPLSIVIPVYNEGGNIERELRGLKERASAPFKVLIVYDFEEDDTLPVAKRVREELDLDVSFLRNKYGGGALNAIKTGLEMAETEYVVVTMADLSDSPETLFAMLAKAASSDADVVCASRYMKGGAQKGGPLLKGLLSRCAGLSLRFLAGMATHDATNSFKLYRKSFLDATPIESSGGFELGLELVVKAHRAGRAIAEIPTVWTDRAKGKSKFKLMKWLPSYLKWYFLAFWKGSRAC